jgi:type II secretory pathway predicted ATPase ExeA
MPTHFLNLRDATVLPTAHYQLTGKVMDDLVKNLATGVIHGPAGSGKTFAVASHLETRAGDDVAVATCSLSFPGRPTMLRVAQELVTVLTGVEPPRSHQRFTLINTLIGLLSGPPRLLVIDEAQRLTSDGLELLRHLHDHERTRFALLYVGGDGCWEVLSREPMLASRIFRRLPFKPLPRNQIPALIGHYHRIYLGADDELLFNVDDVFAHGSLRNWAVFTHTAADLCADAGVDRLDEAIVANSFTLLGGLA